MGTVLQLKKFGNGFYLNIPISFIRKQRWKYGDLFQLESDVISPTYNLIKIGNNDDK